MGDEAQFGALWASGTIKGATMTRKNVTPYPTQIAEHIKTLKRGAAPLSALTLSAVLEHSVSCLLYTSDAADE